MSVLICKMCGGDLEVVEGMTTVRCPYCGTNQTLPKFDNDRRLRLYDLANHFRRGNDYDKAMIVYEQILSEDQTDSEAYWGIVLCRYGIEYVKDPVSHRMMPTVNRTQYNSILADEDYKAALRYADPVQAGIYEQEAKAIDRIQKGIFLISQKEAPYDIFICCRETDEAGYRTKDSVLAEDLYYRLSKNGYKIFFARITLQEKPGVAYEPYIFAALHSAGVMIVVGTAPENLQAVWVRNEWSRYLSLIKQGAKKVLIPVFRDMNPYDLPEDFSHLQALDMSRPGFMQDLSCGINQILGDNRSKPWSTGRKAAIAVLSVIVAVLMIWNFKMSFDQLKASYERQVEDTAERMPERIEEPGGDEERPGISDTRRQEEVLTRQDEVDEDIDFSGILAQFVSRVYDCPAEDVSDSQLAKMQQLVIRRDHEYLQIGYSFDAPTGDLIKGFEDASENGSESNLEWIIFSADTEINLNGLQRFTHLKKLDADTVLRAEYIEGMPLESISAYFDDPKEAAAMLADPGTVRELGFNASVDNLEGIGIFKNLETLYIDYFNLDQIDELVHTAHLKNLTIKSGENLTDFTILGNLTSLEKLYLEAEELKTIKFISSLQNLDTLKIEWTKLNALYGLEECRQLRYLAIIDCFELKEVSAVSELNNLQELSLGIPYGCPEPELGGLTKLNKLTLEGFEDCSFIENMTNLTELNLIYSELPRGIDPSRMTSLKRLSLTHNGYHEIQISDIEAFQTLEILELKGIACYDDISGVFQMPHLRELNIRNAECEINFDRITENSTLEVLHMDEMYLIQNVWFEHIGGMKTGGWDDVVLEEHIDFLKKFPKLKELSLRENELTELSFADEMFSLEILDVSENYITQLDPLAKLPSLQKVICAGNPIADENVLADSVVVITELEEE